MTKELYVSSTPHETKIALVEDDQLAEIFFERENEYTLAGSIYKGRVTRVLPGMQSAFVDIGLERDAFLYVSDFLELPDDEESEFEDIAVSRPETFVMQRPPQEPPRFLTKTAGAPPSAEADGGDAEADDVTEGNTQEFAEVDGAASEGRDSGAEDRARGGRRRRRGRRRGFPETKFAQERPADEQEEPGGAEYEAPAGYEPVILPGESLSKYRREEPAAAAPDLEAVVESEPAGTAVESVGKKRAPVESAAPPQPEPAAPPVTPPVAERGSLSPVLPGESIAKYQSRPAGEAAAPAEPPRSEYRNDRRPRREDRFERRPRPEREPQEFLPEGSGLTLLPGESISKYRNRAAEPAPVTAPATQPPAEPAEPVETKTETKSETKTETNKAVREEEPQAPQAATFVIESEPWTEASAEETETKNRSASYGERPPVARLEREASVSSEASAVSAKAEAKPEAEASVEEAPGNDGTDTRQVKSVPAGPLAAADAQPEPAVESAPVEISAALAEAPAEAAEPRPATEAAPAQDEKEPEAGEPAAIAAQAEAEPGDRDAELGARRRFGEIGRGTLEHEEIEGEEEESGLQAASAMQDEEDADDIELEEETLESGGLARAAENGFEEESEGRSAAGDFRVTEYDFAGADADDETVFEEEELYGEEDAEEEQAEEAEAEQPEETVARGEMRVPAPGTGHPRPERGPDRHDRRGGRRGTPRGRTVRRREQPREHVQIADLLKEGQEVLIQIAKEPIGKKGARITSHIALPGRFLVYMPTVNHVGVSRKITSDEERLRLKRIMISEREGGHGGFIVRTAAAGVGEDELRADIRFLKNLWSQIKQRAESSKAPALIYHDLNLVERVLRDQVTSDFSQIWVDTEGEYERVLNFANRFQPSLVRRVKLYTKETPLFDQFGVTEEINKAMKAKVWLKSGGYIVINQTEALVAIDINTGKYVGKTARLEDTIVKTNVDAIKEIVRQIRLRDLGGIIVIDFIDMDERKNRAKVMQALEEALRNDRAPSKVLAFNDFGLVAITRKRVKQSLERMLGSPCPYCTGNGYVKSVATMCNEIYIELRKMASHLESDVVNLRVNPEIAKALKADRGKWMADFEEVAGRTVMVRIDPLLHQEQFDIH
jgi:ribonuclease G